MNDYTKVEEYNANLIGEGYQRLLHIQDAIAVDEIAYKALSAGDCDVLRINIDIPSTMADLYAYAAYVKV